MLPKTIVFARLSLALFFLLTGLNVSSQVIARSDTTTCDGNSFLYAVPPGGYWTTTGGGLIVTPSSQSTVVNLLDGGSNHFTYHVTGTGSDEVVILNNQVFATAGSNRTDNCLLTATLSGNSVPVGGSGKWETEYPIPGLIISNSASSLTNVSNLPFGNTVFRWSISSNGCSASAVVMIQNNTPENNDGTDQSGCSNVFYIDGETPPAGGTGLWSVAPGSPAAPVFDNINNPGVEITVPRGTSIARWTVSYNGCSSIKDFTIVNNLPNPNAGNDQSLCIDSVVLNAIPPSIGEQGIWTVENFQGEIISNASIHNPLVTNLKQGTTTFAWTINNGICSLSDYIQVVNNRPSVNAGPDIISCDNTYKLSADPASPNTGTWSCNDPSLVFNDIHSNQAVVSNLFNNNYTLKWTVTNGLCTASDNLLLQTKFVNISAGVNNTDCSDTLVLSGSTIPSGGSGYWSLVFGDASIDNSLSINTIARNIGKTAIFRWTIISGSCSFTDEIEYTNQLPSKALAQPDKIVCTDQTLITANPPTETGESGLWTIESGSGNVQIVNPGLFQTLVQHLDQGLNTFRWTISNQFCSSYDLISVTNNSITTNAGADETLCNNSYNLNAFNAGGTGYWTSSVSGIIFTNSTSPTTTATGLVFGSNEFIWTRNDIGCSASDAVVIINQMPTDVFAGPDKTVCDNFTNLNGNNPTHGIGVWSVISGSGNFANLNLYQTDVTNITPGQNIYRWTVTYQSCSAYDEVLITNNKINVSAGANQIICNQPTVELTGSIPSPGQSGNWSLIGGGGMFVTPTLYNTTVASLIKGINTYSWTLNDGTCSGSAQVSITNNTPDSAKVGNDQIICTGITTINAIAVANGTGQWSVVSGGGSILSPALNNTNVTGIPNGQSVYRWTVTKSGCSLTDELSVTNNSVIADIPLSVQSICSPAHSTTLVATEPAEPGANGIWTKITAGTGIIESPSVFVTNVTGLSNGETRFRWTVNNSICIAFDEISIIDDFYTASAGPVGSSNLCVNYAPILGTLPPASGKGLWTAGHPSITFSNTSMAATTVQNLLIGTSTIFWTITNNGCASQASFDLINNYISTDAGKDTAGCEPVAQLNAKALETSQTGYWTSNYAGILFSNSTDPKSQASNIPAGASLFTWTIHSNGCTASDNLLVTNYSFSVSAGNDRVLCGNSYPLTGSDPLATGSGLWTVIEGTGTVANPTGFNTSVMNMSNGNNVFRWTVNRNGCQAYDELLLVNDLYIAQASAPSNVCIDEVQVSSVALPPGSGASAGWTTLFGGGVFDDANANVTMVRNLSQGSNRFRWTVSKGACLSYVNLDVQDNRLTITAGPNQQICTNNSSLYGTPLSPTGTGLWSSSNSNIVFSNPSSASTYINNLERGDNFLTWTITDKGCTGSADIIVTNNSFDTDAGVDQIVTTETTNLSAGLPDLSSTGQWSVLNGFGIFYNPSDPATEVNNLGYGINTFRWTVNWRGCTSYDDLLITYNVAEANAGDDQITCNNFVNLAADRPLIGSGGWSVISGSGQFQNAAAYNTLVTNIGQGQNIYRWTVNAFGNVAYDEVSVTNNSFSTSAGTDQQSCDNFAYMDADSPGVGGFGLWLVIQGSGTIQSSTDNKTLVSNLMVGSNRFMWEVHKNGCVSRDTVLLSHLQPTSTANAGADALVCDKYNSILAANAPTVGTGLWSSGDAGIIIQSPGQFNSSVSNLKDGENSLIWTISNTNCSSSDEVVISVRKTMAITGNPLSKQLVTGEIALFNVETTGDVKSYQWQKNGINLTDDSRISGSASSSLSILNLQMSDEGVYRCIVTGYCNTLNSETASLSIVSGLEEIADYKISVYPNPSKGIVHLEFDSNTQMKKVEVFGLTGNKILSKQISNQKEMIDLSEFGDGMYLLYIKIGEKLINTKIIIQK